MEGTEAINAGWKALKQLTLDGRLYYVNIFVLIDWAYVNYLYYAIIQKESHILVGTYVETITGPS